MAYAIDGLAHSAQPAVVIDGTVLGRISRVAGARAWFTVDSYDRGRHEFGPADLPLHAAAGDPAHTHTPVAGGNHVAAVFVDGDINQPLIVAVYP